MGVGPNKSMTSTPIQLPPLNIKRLLQKYGLRPKKGLGQNFLTDDNALRKIVSVAEISATEVVLEIGPGFGSLTRYLAIHANKVIAVELDKRFIPVLHETLAPYPGIQVVHGDILCQDISQLLESSGLGEKEENYAVVANIPYNITSALIRYLLEDPIKPDRIILTIQKEVAIRICEAPPRMNLLALSVQVYGKPQIAGKIPASAFHPIPKVDSAIIQIPIYRTPLIPPPHTEVFFKLARAGFSQKRKNLRNSLSAGLGLPKSSIETLLNCAQIDHRRRAETLSLDEWETLTFKFYDL